MAPSHLQRRDLSIRTTRSGAIYSGGVVVPRRMRRQPPQKIDFHDLAAAINDVTPAALPSPPLTGLESGTSSLDEGRTIAVESQVTVTDAERVVSLSRRLKATQAENEGLWEKLIFLDGAHDKALLQLRESEEKRAGHPTSCLNIIARTDAAANATKARAKSAEERVAVLEAQCRDLRSQMDQFKRRAEVAKVNLREHSLQAQYLHNELMRARARLRTMTKLAEARLTPSAPPIRRAVNIVVSDSEEDPEEDPVEEGPIEGDPEDEIPGEEAPQEDPEVEDPEENDSEDDSSDSDSSSSDSGEDDYAVSPYGRSWSR